MILVKSVNSKIFEVLNREILLPMIKYFIIKKYPHVINNPKFIELYNDIRDDGRVYKNVTRGLMGVL